MAYSKDVLTSIIHAVVLGVIQGLAEFIPISSSGHLVLVPALFGIEPGGLSFDVALHVGTMLAVVVYMRRELVTILRALIGFERDRDALRYRKLALFAVAASVPVGLVGVALLDTFESIFATPTIAAFMLFATGALLIGGEWMRDRRVERSRALVNAGPATAPRGGEPEPQPPGDRLPVARDPSDPAGTDLDGMGLRQAMLVGVAQCVALLPGISRSGTTIVAGMASGLTREAATRFSFLLSLPALVGATIVSMPDLGNGSAIYPTPAIIAGIVAAFVSGYLAIRVLIALVSRDRLTGFALYCFAAGALSLVVLQVR